MSTGEAKFCNNSLVSLLNKTISIFSSFNSRMIFLTRLPLIPTKAPTGSIFGSTDRTANFVL
ncbi:hypothetical protein CLAVI_000833 [Candidatus Clavichlamydia salmonicola]|nr:hypothetical protein [Candidatus Clavichlamydia salmonicola]